MKRKMEQAEDGPMEQAADGASRGWSKGRMEQAEDGASRGWSKRMKKLAGVHDLAHDLKAARLRGWRQ